MTDDDMLFFKEWFSDYTRSFYSRDEIDQKNIFLKVEHSHNVLRNMTKITESLLLDENRKRLAEASALFHDIGRFPQYAQYKTFRDADSQNHGVLGAETLSKEGVLNSLPANEQQLIINTVKFHNAFAIPSRQSEDIVFFLKLIRDADKVDIFRVFIEYYDSPEEDRASATAFGVPDTPEYSRDMLQALAGGEVASYSSIKTENDFKLMKLSWIYDLHFDKSVELLVKRNYINRIIAKLPQTVEIGAAIINLQKYVLKKVRNGNGA